MDEGKPPSALRRYLPRSRHAKIYSGKQYRRLTLCWKCMISSLFKGLYFLRSSQPTAQTMTGQ